MSNVRQFLGCAAAVGAIARGTIAMAGPSAQADNRSFQDSRTDHSDNDANIHRVSISHQRRVLVKVKHNTLGYYNARLVNSETVFFDLNRRKPGPELKARLDLTNGRASLRNLKNWRVTSTRTCNFSTAINQRTAVASYRLGRNCLGRAGRVRVAVDAAATDYENTSLVHDWYSRPRAFTPWVSRG